VILLQVTTVVWSCGSPERLGKGRTLTQSAMALGACGTLALLETLLDILPLRVSTKPRKHCWEILVPSISASRLESLAIVSC